MNIYAIVQVPRVALALSCSKQTKNNIFYLNKQNKDEYFLPLMQALKNAPDSAMNIWVESSGKSGNTRLKNQNAIERVQKLIDEDIDENEFNPEDAAYPKHKSIYDVIRSIADGNGSYKGSFFSKGGKHANAGQLFHQFSNVCVNDSTPRKDDKLYIKFIAPEGIIDEKEIYDLWNFQTESGEPIENDLKITDVKSGGNQWEFISYHGGQKVDGR